MLSSLGTLMSLGNEELAAISRLQASVIAKPGGLKKHNINRWYTGLGTGPSYQLCQTVMRDVEEYGTHGIIAYNQARKQLPVSHANLDAKWLVNPPKAAVRPTAQEVRVKMKSIISQIETSGVRVDLLRGKLNFLSSGDNVMEDIPPPH